MIRAAFFVDGFNLYHSIMSSERTTRCRWLDLRGLCEAFLTQSETLEKVTYFTSLARWKPEGARRHWALIEALRSTGVEVVFGQFKKRHRPCKRCGQTFGYHEEKRTDVNVATRLLRDAVRDHFDRAYLVTGDADLIPAIDTLRDLAPHKQVHVVFPYRRVTEDLKRSADRIHRIRPSHLERHLLPLVVQLPGSRTVECPDEWRSDLLRGQEPADSGPRQPDNGSGAGP